MVSLVDMLVAPTSVECAVGTIEQEVLTEATKYNLPYILPERGPLLIHPKYDLVDIRV